MKAHMDRQLHHQLVQRALDLGRSANPAAVSELARLLNTPIAEVRRLAASALGKLAAFGADAAVAVRALVPVALHDPHPQVQQYALKALKASDYKIGMLKKQQLYQQQGKRLISLYPDDKTRMHEVLLGKLDKYR
jgi:HEAT repeat protein